MIRPLRVVGLDVSNAATAIAATHDRHGQPFLSVFTVPDTAARPLHEQVATIERSVRRACGWTGSADGWVRPDVVVFEGTFSRPGGSDYPLHALHGNLKQWMWRHHIPYVDVAPSTVKLWATGSGSQRGATKVTKAPVVEAILATYGSYLLINPRDNNQTDAVALLTMGLAAYGQPLTEPPSLNHRKALKTPKWPTLPLFPKPVPYVAGRKPR